MDENLRKGYHLRGSLFYLEIYGKEIRMKHYPLPRMPTRIP